MGEISIIQALLIGVVVFISSVDDLVGFWGMQYPMQIGFFVGLILGQPLEGIVYGGFFELIFLGMKSIGGAQPPNRMIGSAIGIALAISSGQSPEYTLAIAFPVALLTQAAVTFWFAINSTRVPKIEALIEAGEIKKATRAILTGTCIHGLFHAAIVVVTISVGVNYVEAFITNMPMWILDGFKLSGHILPGVGFAIILSYFFTPKNSVYYFLGFLIAIYLNVPPLGISLLAISIALLQYRAGEDILDDVKNLQLTSSSENDGI